MNATLEKARGPLVSSLQYFFWLHPEWWSIALSGVAWMAMLRHGWAHAGHEAVHAMTPFQEVGAWLLMVAAMMLPLVIHRVWVTAAGSLWRRRHRAIAGFLAGYFTPWLVLGVAVAALRQGSWAHHPAAVALGFLGAAAWQLTPMRKRASAACHRTEPLAPTGWRADRDCIRFGGVIGVACVARCWPLMLACAFAGHGLVAMTGGMALGATERWSFRPPKRAVSAGTLALAAYYSVLAAR